MSSSLRARGEGLAWLIGAVVCLLAANRGSTCSQMLANGGNADEQWSNGWPHSALWYH